MCVHMTSFELSADWHLLRDRLCEGMHPILNLCPPIIPTYVGTVPLLHNILIGSGNLSPWECYLYVYYV